MGVLQQTPKEEYSRPRPEQSTTPAMQMEIEAITHALKWLMTQKVQHTTLITDSQSLLRKIERSIIRSEWLEHNIPNTNPKHYMDILLGALCYCC